MEAEGKKLAGRGGNTHKDVKSEDRSGNVYENKGPDDNSPDTKDDISARLDAILHKNTRILWELSTCLPLFGQWKTSPRLNNLETRGLSADGSARGYRFLHSTTKSRGHGRS